MLTDYDAKAVADVMGIAFLRSPDGESSLVATPDKTTNAGLALPGDRLAGDFVIRVDDATILVVEAGTPDRPARLGPSNNRISRWPGHGMDPVSSPSPLFIEKAVEKGLPRQALRHVAESLAGGDKAKISSLEWGVVPKTTLERREKQLSPQESERTERVARLFVHARRALGSEAEAREFMTTPHPQLEGRSPLDAARTDLGTRRTEQILNALEYGLAL
ncbi:antitoxin Xre/MbcA/ParS toxin-binding domain-containing protein [Rhodopila globiformis]|nr:antitoxin Xre/MbcA/ParS toxin-binding domain-containing protein [Rhodopila globiformis]